MFHKYCFLVLLIVWAKCDDQIGPDPWDYASNVITQKPDDDDIPHDLRAITTKKVHTNTIGTGEWFYKRILAIILKGGVIKKNEDGSIDIALQMRYSQEHWNVLDEYITSNTGLTEDMFRRSMGYVEEAIYKPTITEKIVMAWTEYVQQYLIEYKIYIAWTSSILAVIGTTFWLLNHVSYKHIIILVFIGFYMYEVFVSYKEAEKKELDRFLTAVNTCKWFIWSSTCEVPPPDPLIFLKHMNPLKIVVRMFSVVLSEPMITISETVRTITHEITDGLWYPFDKIMYGLLMVTFNALIIFLVVMIIFNYIFNIPYKLNFLGIGIGLKQRKRSFQKVSSNNVPPSAHTTENVDRISGETLSRLLDVCSKALSTTQSAKVDSIHNVPHQSTNLLLRTTQPAKIASIHNVPCQSTMSLTHKPKMPRSASTGRLPNLVSN